MTQLSEVLLPAQQGREARSVRLVRPDDLPGVLAALPARQAEWVRAVGFRAASGECLLVPGEDGAPAMALAGMGEEAASSLAHGALAMKLPEGLWRFEPGEGLPPGDLLALGWVLSAYRFAVYRSPERRPARLVCPENADRQNVLLQAEGIWLARDLVNTPVEDLGPADLARHAQEMSETFGGRVAVVEGQALEDGFPLIHVVGRAAPAERAPRLIDLTWGRADAPRVTLVGKGVCFDTGGLNLKPDRGMILMKKDMGGAAAALALARMIMAAELDVRLRVLVPAVENSVGGEAMRPSDVIRSRSGLTVEIGNTDAEGRLILADALTAAWEEDPDLVIDLATLTGAARVALGPDLPAMFTEDDALAAELVHVGMEIDDPLWHMPLWAPYEKGLKSGIADTGNISSDGFAGSIIAALFLRKFVGDPRRWVHLDIFGWNPADRPARPKGGDAQAVRTLFSMLRARHAA